MPPGRMANAGFSADEAFHDAIMLIKRRLTTPAELRDIKIGMAEMVAEAYAMEIESPAQIRMTAAELHEHVQASNELITCLRAEVEALGKMLKLLSSRDKKIK